MIYKVFVSDEAGEFVIQGNAELIVSALEYYTRALGKYITVIKVETA
jgi:hypothetical protein